LKHILAVAAHSEAEAEEAAAEEDEEGEEVEEVVVEAQVDRLPLARNMKKIRRLLPQIRELRTTDPVVGHMVVVEVQAAAAHADRDHAALLMGMKERPAGLTALTIQTPPRVRQVLQTAVDVEFQNGVHAAVVRGDAVGIHIDEEEEGEVRRRLITMKREGQIGTIMIPKNTAVALLQAADEAEVVLAVTDEEGVVEHLHLPPHTPKLTRRDKISKTQAFQNA